VEKREIQENAMKSKNEVKMLRRNIRFIPALCILLILFYAGLTPDPERNRSEDQVRKPGLVSGPTLILHNANVITMDTALPTAQAVAIEDNRITAVGQDAAVLGMADPLTRILDLEGRTVVPGLIEGHTHILQHGWQNDGIDGVKRVLEAMAADGFTTVHDMNLHDPGLLDAVIELESRDELAVRVNFYPNYGNPDGSLRDDGWWTTHPYTTNVDTLVRIVGVKFYADGGVSGVPAVSRPYMGGSQAGSYGDCWYSQTEMDSIVKVIHDAGYPIAVHCLGDSGVGLMVNAFDKVFAGSGNSLRHRLEHCRVMREDLADRMATLGLVASIQYTWAREATADRYELLYYPEVLDWMFPWRRMIDKGIRLVGGNDWPYTVHQNAMHVISLVTSRRDVASESLSDWLDGDELTVEQAIRSMTMDAAWVCFEEEDLGSIEVGKLADLTVLSDDPLTTDPFDIRYITTEMTIMDGVIRYDQLGNIHTAVHDTGTFRLGIDDRGFWGTYRSLDGLEFDGEEHLAMGSLLISYDDYTTATALHPQYDYETTQDGHVDLQEPGEYADEEVRIQFEDTREHHPGRIEVTQTSSMWDGDSSVLIQYTFKNTGQSNLEDLYVGQYMDFDILGWRNSGVWVEDGDLGFATMTNPDYPDSVHIGLALFDSTGRYVNTGTAFPVPGGRTFTWNEEGVCAGLMRGQTMETAAGDPYDYSILLSYGPMSLASGESRSPFTMALAVARSADGLMDAMQDAVDRLMTVTGQSGVHWHTFDAGQGEPFCQNYPNPFNASTQFLFTLKRSGPVSLEILDLLGRRVELLMDRSCEAGEHSVQWNAGSNPAGIYIYRLRTPDYTLTRKLILQK
jgi:predicted amidohydrolase YtcJ